MDIKDRKVEDMSIIEMLGIKNIDMSFAYYSGTEKDEIAKDIEEALRKNGVSEDNPNYQSILDEFKKEAFEMKDRVTGKTREQFMSSEYSRLRDEFGFGEKETIEEKPCSYDTATKEEEEKIKEDRGILGNAVRDLKNFVTAKNRAGKGAMVYFAANVVCGSVISLLVGSPAPLILQTINGALPTIPYFFGAIGKNVRREVMPENAITKMVDKVDDYFDEPVSSEKSEPSMMGTDRKYAGSRSL